MAPAAVFHRDDRAPPRPRVAAEREHRHLRVDARGDDARRVETDREFVGAGRAPSRRQRAATTAPQRKDQSKHSQSVTTRTDNYAVGPAGPTAEATPIRE